MTRPYGRENASRGASPGARFGRPSRAGSSRPSRPDRGSRPEHGPRPEHGSRPDRAPRPAAGRGPSRSGRPSESLRRQLLDMDHRGYPAYKDLRGSYDFGAYVLSIDHVQGDPFASPSKVSVFVPHEAADFPADLFDAPHKRVAFEDFLVRRFGAQLARFSFKAGGSGKSGLLATSRPGPEILQRSACTCDERGIAVRFEVGFPANGRSINAPALAKVLFDFVPQCVERALMYRRYSAQDAVAVRAVADLAEDQRFIRDELARLGLVSFVADGSVLPRESGVSSRPMRGARPFVSPESLRVTLDLPHAGPTSGMGVRRGVTLVVGGGYHGKSTLLKAIEAGVYDHVAGDGREYVITDDTAVKLRAEDGRAVRNVDISLFIGDLPNGKDTRRFSTDDASGSTSQAASTIEAVEAGCRAFLIDEDTSATNFMVRDGLMASIVSRSHEPITPFVERVRDLYEKSGISSVIVAGSSGAFFYVADTVIQMDCYEALDITEQVRDVCRAHPDVSVTPAPGYALHGGGRMIGCGRASCDEGGVERGGHRSGHAGRGGRDRTKVKTTADTMTVGHASADLRLVEQLVDAEQTATLAQMVRLCVERGLLADVSVGEAVDRLLEIAAREGLGALGEGSYTACGLALPRRHEVFACLNRYRGW